MSQAYAKASKKQLTFDTAQLHTIAPSHVDPSSQHTTNEGGQGMKRFSTFGVAVVSSAGLLLGAIGPRAGVPATATLASVFCIASTGNGIVDGAADLPGPGAVSLPGTYNAHN